VFGFYDTLRNIKICGTIPLVLSVLTQSKNDKGKKHSVRSQETHFREDMGRLSLRASLLTAF
jgi:hypothetical protein